MSVNAYIFVGPPGAGKGSLSSLCEEELGWKRLSTGDLCRKHIADKTKIGKQIDFALKSGILVSDRLITDMVAEWIKNLSPTVHAIILDGYPRTIGQAQLFDELLKAQCRSLTLKIIKFFIADGAVIDRLLNRYICENAFCQKVYSISSSTALSPQVAMTCDACSARLIQREDDKPEAIRERLAIYHQHTEALIDFYLQSGYPVIEFNVDRSLYEVFEEFKKLMCLSGV